MLREEKVFADVKQNLEERISHEPLGVVANISAWNYPYFVGANVFVPALLAGNAVLYKPSEFATLTGRHIADLMHESGVPRMSSFPYSVAALPVRRCCGSRSTASFSPARTRPAPRSARRPAAG